METDRESLRILILCLYVIAVANHANSDLTERKRADEEAISPACIADYENNPPANGNCLITACFDDGSMTKDHLHPLVPRFHIYLTPTIEDGEIGEEDYICKFKNRALMEVVSFMNRTLQNIGYMQPFFHVICNGTDGFEITDDLPQLTFKEYVHGYLGICNCKSVSWSTLGRLSTLTNTQGIILDETLPTHDSNQSVNGVFMNTRVFIIEFNSTAVHSLKVTDPLSELTDRIKSCVRCSSVTLQPKLQHQFSEAITRFPNSLFPRVDIFWLRNVDLSESSSRMDLSPVGKLSYVVLNNCGLQRIPFVQVRKTRMKHIFSYREYALASILRADLYFSLDTLLNQMAVKSNYLDIGDQFLVRSLSLSYNNISYVDVTPELNYYDAIGLDNNFLKSEGIRSLSKLKDLLYLNIQSNAIYIIPHNAWQIGTNLEVLVMGNNRLTNISLVNDES